jgi:fumarate hydratase subunit beta
MARKITTPLTDEVLAELRAGDEVELTGVIYTARDAAHRRLVEALEKGQPLPIDLKGQVIYYVGPTPPRPGQVIGSAGPTTALRMDTYTPPLLAAGLKATIGKGGRSQQLRELMKSHRAVYFGAIGGAGALLSRQIRKAEVVAYPDLGPEAIYRLEVEDFPLVVVDDIYGNDLLEMGKAQWRREVP